MNQMTHTVIGACLTDVLSLERTFEAALSRQIHQLLDEPAIARELRQVHAVCDRHIAALELVGYRLDHEPTEVPYHLMRETASTPQDVAAGGTIAPTEQLTRDITDDCANLARAMIGYVTLHTMGLALGEEAVAELARLHFREYTRCTMTLHGIAPAAVIRHLVEEGQPADASVVPDVEESILDAWRPTLEPMAVSGPGRKR